MDSAENAGALAVKHELGAFAFGETLIVARLDRVVRIAAFFKEGFDESFQIEEILEFGAFL